jgi:hypothetical protein
MSIKAKRGELLIWFNDTLNFVKKENIENCIEWPFCRGKDGYGLITWRGKTFRVHRLMLSLYCGYTPKHLHCLHGPCNNPICINPRHLRWGTDKDNAQDRKRDGTEGNHKGENNSSAKLTKKQVLDIRKDPRPNTIIAKEYSIHRSHVSNIKVRNVWKHLDDD